MQALLVFRVRHCRHVTARKEWKLLVLGRCEIFPNVFLVNALLIAKNKSYILKRVQF